MGWHTTFSTYRNDEQRELRRASAYTHFRHNFRFAHTQSIKVEGDPDQNLDRWPCWIRQHERLIIYFMNIHAKLHPL